MGIHYASVIDKANEISDQLSRWRRELHANPELSFREYRTTQFVADILGKMQGMEVFTGPNYTGLETGVIGKLSFGEGPTIGIRADMDALPIQEENEHDFVSQNDGVMHACGHDAHTAILLGVAQLLSESYKNQEFKGTIKFIFQPAEEDIDEEGFTGSPHLVQAGVLEDVDAVLALHMCPWNPVGVIQVNDGYSMANVDVFSGEILGTGGHAAYPHLGTDPIWMVGSVLQAIQGIISRKVSPLNPAVISVTQVHAGNSSNVTPTNVSVSGTLRSYDPEVREFLIDELEKAFSVVKVLGGDYTFDVIRGEPALKNHKEVNVWIKQTIKDLYPEFMIKEEPFGLGGEDFGYMTQAASGAMFFLGCSLSDGMDRDLHTPIFDLDERCLPIGVSILTETTLRYLRGEYELKNN